MLVIALLAAGCGGSGSSDSSGEASTDPGVAAARKDVAAHSPVPAFAFDGPPVDAAQAAGKTIFWLPAISSIPYQQGLERRMAATAKLAGLQFIAFQDQGQPSEWVQGMNQAIQRGVDEIVLSSVPPELVGPQIKRSREAGIQVMELHATDLSAPLSGGLSAQVPGPFDHAAALLANYAIADSNGDAHALVITSNEVSPSKGMVEAIQSTLGENCSGCSAKVVNVPVNQWASNIQSETQTALLADPSINYVLPIYDSMALYVVPGIKAAGRTDSVKVASYNGTPAILAMIDGTGPVTMDVGESLDWLAFAGIDQSLRLLTGKEPVADEQTPLRVFDAANVAEAGEPPTYAKGYGDSYRDAYMKLWGLR
jgi:ribose transport system substrate-binding protein